MKRAIPSALLWLAPLLTLPASNAPADICDFKVYLDDNGEFTQAPVGREGSYFNLYLTGLND